jgi:hypothetical protein
MKIVLLHTKDAVDGEEDPVLGQIEGCAARRARDAARDGRQRGRASRDRAHERTAGPRDQPRESFAGKSALESNIAALLNLLDLRYTGSSPAGCSSPATRR